MQVDHSSTIPSGWPTNGYLLYGQIIYDLLIFDWQFSKKNRPTKKAVISQNISTRIRISYYSFLSLPHGSRGQTLGHSFIITYLHTSLQYLGMALERAACSLFMPGFPTLHGQS
jgi:hypothetical protein